MKIPSNRSYLGTDEPQALIAALETGRIIGNGPISVRVQQQLQEMFRARYVLLTTSCTLALEMAMLAVDIGPGDEVILPSFTFVSTSNPVVLRGATPVFAEIRSDTLNIDPVDIRRRITTHTKAIIPVHYAGVASQMDEIMAIAAENNLTVIEDAAQGVDALYKGRYLGTIGDMGCYSFHGTKNITCGEGGAFVTNNPEIAHQAEIFHEKGTNRAAFIRGQVDKYTWVSTGSSYVLSDLLAALLEVQLSKKDEIKSRRKSVWESYLHGLQPLAEDGKIILPVIPEGCESNYHIFFFRVNDPQIRTDLLDHLRTNGIGATFHYIPLHSAPFGRNTLGCNTELPVTDICSQTLIRLPIYPGLAAEEIQYVLERITDFYALK